MVRVPLARARHRPWPLDACGRRHADAGVDNQLAFLQAALDWVAAHTDRDRETSHLEATVTYWLNDDAPRTVVLRSPERTAADAG
ncbi:MAG: hypothetical protein ACRD0A_11070 [Acidimicrobiales bacterium]